MTLYYPLLRTKQGEIKALLQMSSSSYPVVSPILQVPPPDLDEDNDPVAPDTTFVDRVVKTVAKVFDVSATGLLCYLDPRPAQLPPPLLHYLLQGLHHNAIPPRPLYHFQGSRLYATIYQSVFGTPSSAVLRIDVNDALAATPAAVAAELAQLGISPGITTLLVDAGDISSPTYPMAPIQSTMAMLINQLASLGFAGIAVGSCALPTKMTLTKWVPVVYPRLELDMFRTVKRATGLPLHFADYATGNVITGPSPSFLGTPKVRYTFAAGYFVVRGEKPKLGLPSHDSQYQRLSTHVQSSPHYTHPGFSYGDAHIDYAALASNVGKRGNAATWVAVNTSHHLAQVVSMLPSM